MSRFMVRKLGATGHTCVAVAENELMGLLRPELASGFSVALRTEETTRFIGDELDSVMVAVSCGAEKGAEELRGAFDPARGWGLSSLKREGERGWKRTRNTGSESSTS